MRENVDWAPRGLEEEEVEEASLESESARPRGQAGPRHTLNWEYARLRHRIPRQTIIEAMSASTLHQHHFVHRVQDAES